MEHGSSGTGQLDSNLVVTQRVSCTLDRDRFYCTWPGDPSAIQLKLTKKDESGDDIRLCVILSMDVSQVSCQCIVHIGVTLCAERSDTWGEDGRGFELTTSWTELYIIFLAN